MSLKMTWLASTLANAPKAISPSPQPTSSNVSPLANLAWLKTLSRTGYK